MTYVFAWLGAWFEKHKKKQTTSTEDSDSSDSEVKEPVNKEIKLMATETEADTIALAKQCLSIREQARQLFPDELVLHHFKAEPVGTDYTHTVMGVASDVMKAEAVSSYAKRMVKEHFKRQGNSFGITKKLSISDASLLAYWWRHKIEFFCQIYAETGHVPGWKFSNEDVSAYIPLDRFTAWRAALDDKHAAHSRFPRLDSLKPKYLMTAEEYAVA